MAYTIYNTDGSILLTLGDGKIDQKYTSLTLIGKNVNAYGEYFNNNLVSILGNFANTDEPRSPVVGQLWYDTAEGRMKVYDLNSIFRPITNTIAGDAVPSELAPNDFWWDTVNKQIKFYAGDGTTNDPYVIGPVDSALLGRNGWAAEVIVDDGGNDNIVTSLYSAGQRVGILSTTSFIFAASTSGMTSVSVGLNLNPSINNIRFIGTATSAESVAGLDVNTFVRSDINQTMLGSLTIENDLGLHVMNSQLDSFSIVSNPTTHQGIISYDSTDKVFKLQVTNGILGSTPVLYVDSATLNAGIWNQTPLYPLDIVGNTRVQGTFIVEGTLTNIKSDNLTIVDKNIEIASGQVTPLDTYADGGGFTLKGTTDHKVYWKNNTTGWNFNDHANLYLDPLTYSNLSAVSVLGAGATFTVVNTDGVYSVSSNNTGTNYTTQTAITSWTTSTPLIATWTTSTGSTYWPSWKIIPTTFYNVTGTSSLSGTGFTIDIAINTSSQYELPGTVASHGTGYVPGEVVTFAGTLLGGTTPTNDLNFWVSSIGGSGDIVDGEITGTNVAVASTTTPFQSWDTSTIASTYWTTSTPLISVDNTNRLTITGDYLGGATPANDLTIYVTSTSTNGSIANFTYSGSGNTWEYKISSSTVITKTSLGSGIVSAPGLASVGVLSKLTVTNIYLQGNTIQTIGTNQTLYLDASGTGTVDVSSNKITSVATPTSDNDAANKKYVDDTLFKTVQNTFGLILDVTGVGNIDEYVQNELTFLYPPVNNISTPGYQPGDESFDLPLGSRAKVICNTIEITTSSSVPAFVNFNTVSVDKAGAPESVDVIEASASTASIVVYPTPQKYYSSIVGTTYQTWVVSTSTTSTAWWVKIA